MDERTPSLAAVRPRIVRPGSELPRLLEEEVAELLDAGKPVRIALCGPDGCGKATALNHLAAVFADDPRLNLERHDPREGSSGAIVDVITRRHPLGDQLAFHLQPWTDDDVIEYMLCKHPKDVARVVPLWQQSTTHDLLDWPGLSAGVLDNLTANEQRPTVRAALVDVLADRIGERYADAVAFAQRVERGQRRHKHYEYRPNNDLLDLRDVFGSATARGTLIADCLLQHITLQFRGDHMIVTWSRDLQEAIVDAMQTNVQGRSEILAIAERPRIRQKALLHSVLALWRKGHRPKHALRGDLDNAWLPNIDMHGHRVRGSFVVANLSGADLTDTLFDRCSLRDADLRGATATNARFIELAGLSLNANRIHAPGSLWREARLNYASFRSANLECADFDGARLINTDFRKANLSNARLCDTALTKANVAGADMRSISLAGATIGDVDFRPADLRDANLRGAELNSCSFANMDMRGAVAPMAEFANCNLTGTYWPNAALADASFARCGLAEVHWEGADLRGADLRGATFHLGNSRSGKIDSTTPSEGSRTGYYTDESLEEQFQTPEDVRKANLRNCDLRDARILGVDFYLVDLRGARLSPLQRRWAERCRAILDRLVERERPAEE